MALAASSEDLLNRLAGIDRAIHSPARLMVLTYLYVAHKGDVVYLMRQTGLTWGNLSSHLRVLEEAGYLAVEKEFLGRKPHTMLSLTDQGRAAFRAYRSHLKGVFDDLPE